MLLTTPKSLKRPFSLTIEVEEELDFSNSILKRMREISENVASFLAQKSLVEGELFRSGRTADLHYLNSGDLLKKYKYKFLKSPGSQYFCGERLVEGQKIPYVLFIKSTYTKGDKILCSILPLIEGEDLETRLKRGMTHEEIVHIIAQVAMGLAHLHARNLVHRDLRSSNILIDREENAQIADLSLLAEVKASLSERVGALYSPEQHRFNGYGIEVDLWALGCLIYTCYHRKVPPISEFALGSSEEPGQDIPFSAPHCPKKMKDLILELLRKDPKKRPSAQEVADHLKAFSEPLSSDSNLPSPAGTPNASDSFSFI